MSLGAIFRSLVAILKEYKGIVLVTVLISIFTFIALGFVTKWYAVDMLVKSGSLSLEADQSSLGANILGLKKLDGASGSLLKSESAAYIVFKYQNLNKIYPDLDKFVSDVEDILDTNMYRIRIKAHSLDTAEHYAKTIFKDISEKYNVPIEKKMQDNQKFLNFSVQAKENLEKKLNTIVKSIQRTGFNPALLEKQVGLEQNIYQLKKDILKTEALLGPESLSKFELIGIKPVRLKAIYPRRLKMTTIVFFLVGLMLFLLSILLKDFKVQRKD